MNKKELVAKIAQSTGLPLVQVARALDSTINIIRDELIDKPGKKSGKALDSTIHLMPEAAVDAEYNKPKALDSTIALMRPEQEKPPKKGRALDSTIDLIPDHVVESGKKSNRALDSTIHLLEEELVTAGKVKIPGLGTFYTVARKARTGRNPRTGAAVKIPAKIVPKFKFSKTLVDRINK